MPAYVKKSERDFGEPDAVEPVVEKPVSVDGYTTLTAPSGFKTSVPDTIKDALIASGYKK